MTVPEATPAPEGIVVRPGAVADLPVLAGVHHAARAAGEMPDAGELAEVRDWTTSWDLDEHDLWVAEAPDGPGVPVGYVRLHGAWLDDLYVAPEHQGRGIGSLLLDVVCSMRPAGFGLWVFTANTRARAFYRARGLVELEHTDGSGNREHEPDVRLAWPGDRPLRYLREAIDDVDDELALLLARRVALAGAVQDVKTASGGRGGHDARDPDREQEILDRMSRLAPALPRERMARVLGVVLEEGLAAWHERVRPGPV